MLIIFKRNNYKRKENKVWQSIELNTDTLVTMVVVVFLMMAILCKFLKRDSLPTSGLILRDLEIRRVRKVY